MDRSQSEAVITPLLELVYPETHETARIQLLELTDRYVTQLAGVAATSGPSQDTTVLITYGDTIRSEGEVPLATLRSVLNSQVGDAITDVHILPMFPYTSDDGFAVVDYRKINPGLGCPETSISSGELSAESDIHGAGMSPPFRGIRPCTRPRTVQNHRPVILWWISHHLGISGQQIRFDRILDEAHATGGDIRPSSIYSACRSRAPTATSPPSTDPNQRPTSPTRSSRHWGVGLSTDSDPRRENLSRPEGSVCRDTGSSLLSTARKR